MVSQLLLDVLGVVTGADAEAGVGVSQVVDSDAAQLGLFKDLA